MLPVPLCCVWPLDHCAFNSFEKTFTKFKAPNGQPAPSTAELLESSGILLPQVASKIRQLREEYAQHGGLDDASYEELSAKIHQLIAVEGGIHYGGIGMNHIFLQSACLTRSISSNGSRATRQHSNARELGTNGWQIGFW